MIKFASKYLPPLMKFMAKSDIRYYLMGIHIEPDPKGGAILVATDGHRMLVIKDKSAEFTHEVPKEGVIFNINKDAAKFCKESARIKAGHVTIDEAERLTIFTDKGLEAYIQPGKCLVNGKYPEWKRVMPDFTQLKQASYAYIKPEYVAEAALIHPDKGGRHYGIGVRFWQESENSSVAVEYSHHPEYCAIIMPLRTDNAAGAENWMKVFGNPKAESVPKQEKANEQS